MKTINDIFYTTNSLKVLSFLAENSGKEFLGSEIQKATGLSRAGVYVALRYLVHCRLAFKEHKGKFLIYTVAHTDPVVKQFKVLRVVQILRPVISRLAPLAVKIVLYGSAGRGEDGPESDIDLFIVSRDAKSVSEILSSVRSKRNIQAVIKVPSELADFKEKEKIFFEEVDRGITLLEAAG